jgi:hypothetical protein
MDSKTLLDPNVFGAPQTVGQVVAGALPAGSSGASSDQLGQLATQLQQLQTVSQAETETILANTLAVTQNTTQLGQSNGPSTASKVGSTLESALGLGLGLSPLITGLLGLFGGGGNNSQSQAPAAFVLPPSISVSAGASATPTPAFGVDYTAGGQPRGATTSASAPQITVQVQAMDSQSFLDHSNDIAQAVRQAMLESSVLNDVIREV